MAGKTKTDIRSSAAEYLTFVAAGGKSAESIEIRYEDENIWLTQKMMAVLYDASVSTINEHIKNILADHELQEEATIRNFRIVQTEGDRSITRSVKHYGLQMIIAVGFKRDRAFAVKPNGNFISRLCRKYGVTEDSAYHARLGNAAYRFYRNV